MSNFHLYFVVKRKTLLIVHGILIYRAAVVLRLPSKPICALWWKLWVTVARVLCSIKVQLPILTFIWVWAGTRGRLLIPGLIWWLRTKITPLSWCSPVSFLNPLVDIILKSVKIVLAISAKCFLLQSNKMQKPSQKTRLSKKVERWVCIGISVGFDMDGVQEIISYLNRQGVMCSH